MKKGVDVSAWQGKIDWNKVKNSGIEFAILKIGNIYQNDNNWIDTEFERNYNECKRLNIPVGVYVYTYCKTMEKIKEGANFVVNALKGKTLDLPVYLDLEDKLISNLGKDNLTNMACEFGNIIEKAGFWCGMYANKNWLDNILDAKKLERFTIWIAQYNSTCTYKGKYDIWQYSSSGSVAGINGKVDMNYMYRDLIAAVGNKTSNTTNNTSNKNEVVENVENNVQNSTVKYIVKSGDTLSKIAAKYNTTYQKIAADNNIADPNKIYPGQVLLITTDVKEETVKAPEMRIGAKVQYQGYLYKDSYGNGKGRYVNGTYTVTTLIKNRAYGVNLNSGLGWVKESNCKVIG